MKLSNSGRFFSFVYLGFLFVCLFSAPRLPCPGTGPRSVGPFLTVADKSFFFGSALCVLLFFSPVVSALCACLLPVFLLHEIKGFFFLRFCVDAL